MYYLVHSVNLLICWSFLEEFQCLYTNWKRQDTNTHMHRLKHVYSCFLKNHLPTLRFRFAPKKNANRREKKKSRANLTTPKPDIAPENMRVSVTIFPFEMIPFSVKLASFQRVYIGATSPTHYQWHNNLFIFMNGPPYKPSQTPLLVRRGYPQGVYTSRPSHYHPYHRPWSRYLLASQVPKSLTKKTSWGAQLVGFKLPFEHTVLMHRIWF